MPIKQTRRAISFKGSTYVRMRNYCQRKGISIAGKSGELLEAFLDDAQEPVPTPEQVREQLAKPVESTSKTSDDSPESPAVSDIVSQYFSF